MSIDGCDQAHEQTIAHEQWLNEQARYTRGPCEAALQSPDFEPKRAGWCVVGPSREIIASVYGGGTQALTDARVLAASFDLLGALQMQMSWKMRDGTPCCCPAGEHEDDMPRPKKMPTVHASNCVEARAALKKAMEAR